MSISEIDRITVHDTSASCAHVPEAGGTTEWFNDDIYWIKLTTATTAGAVGLVEGVVSPGCGPAPHCHIAADETVVILSGELTFRVEDRTFTAQSGATVFVPRGHLHRFVNTGIRPARMIFVYTPGGPEKLYVEGGEQPQPGVPPHTSNE